MKRNLWPHAIILYFVVFITGVITWVIFAARHQDQLVRPDYYDHEIRFQEQIDRAKGAAAFDPERLLVFEANAQSLVVQLPASPEIQGKIRLYRPSNARLDREISLQLDEAGIQALDLSELESGLWKASLIWKCAGREYFVERALIVKGR
jgi:hypothetical protein